MFDSKQATTRVNAVQKAVIKNFFTAMNPSVTSQVNFKDLLSNLNTEDKWLYKGSMTTPPCYGPIIQNVARTVYPIDKDLVDGLN